MPGQYSSYPQSQLSGLGITQDPGGYSEAGTGFEQPYGESRVPWQQPHDHGYYQQNSASGFDGFQTSVSHGYHFHPTFRGEASNLPGYLHSSVAIDQSSRGSNNSYEYAFNSYQRENTSGSMQVRRDEPLPKRLKPNHIPPVVTKYEVPEHVKKRHLEQVQQLRGGSGLTSWTRSPASWPHGQAPQPFSSQVHFHDLPTPSSASPNEIGHYGWPVPNQPGHEANPSMSSRSLPFTPQASPHMPGSLIYQPPQHIEAISQAQSYPNLPVPLNNSAIVFPDRSDTSLALRPMNTNAAPTVEKWREDNSGRRAIPKPYWENREADMRHDHSHMLPHKPETSLAPYMKRPGQEADRRSESKSDYLLPFRPASSHHTKESTFRSDRVTSGDYDPTDPSAGLHYAMPKKRKSFHKEADKSLETSANEPPRLNQPVKHGRGDQKGRSSHRKKTRGRRGKRLEREASRSAPRGTPAQAQQSTKKKTSKTSRSARRRLSKQKAREAANVKVK